MHIASLLHRLRQHIRNLRDANSGNVAITFAVALLPVVGLTGGAIDYSRASSVRAAMQAALDATALAMSKEASTLSSTQLNEKAAAYFAAAFDRPEAQNIAIDASYTTEGGSSVTVAGSGSIKSYFLGVIGVDTIPIGSYAKTAWGIGKLRVALVLDMSLSMNSGGRMTALKTATKELLTTLQSAAVSPGDVQVAIVPFNRNVNVGSNNYTASWISWADWHAEPANLRTSKPNNWSDIGPGSSCPFSNYSHGFRCTTGPTSTTITSTIPSSGSYSGYICPSTNNNGKQYHGCYDSVPTTVTNQNTVCTGLLCSCGTRSNCSCTGSGFSKVCKQTVTTVGAPYTHTWIPADDHHTWNGCVTDRDQDYDVKNTTPTEGEARTLFPAEQYTDCPVSVMPLSDNWTSLKSKVDTLTPTGYTNQPIGLAWGWMALSEGAPLFAPAITDNSTSKVIILLSDGENTEDRWYSQESPINARQRLICDNIKAANIQVFSVLLVNGNESLMRDCATKSEMFFKLDSANQVISAFSTIGTNLAKLRLTR